MSDATTVTAADLAVAAMLATGTAPEAVAPITGERFLDTDTVVELRSEAKRELDIRVVPWNTIITHQYGPEMFERGAFADVDPTSVLLKGPDSEGSHKGPVVGRGIASEDREDGQYVTFRVSKTQAGDELLTLYADKVIKKASVGFYELPGGTSIQVRDGRRTRVQSHAGMEHVAATWRPAYPTSEIVAMRSQQTEGEPVPADTETPDTSAADRALAAAKLAEEGSQRILDRLEKIQERERMEIVVPQGQVIAPGARTGEWFQTALKVMTGEHVNEVQKRALADLITADNIGVVPDAVVQSELIGLIDRARPFLETTRELNLPASGMTLTVPVIVTRPTVGIQAEEKDDITSTTTSITTTSFPSVTVAGGGDISIQLLKRSDPSYLDLYLQLLAEAYATDADALAVATLLDSGTTDGTGNIDPENLEIGEAWTNAVGVSRLLRPDHIWMSTRAIQEFIDAKASGTNAPLYSDLAADITVGGGARGLISGLTPVYVPGMDGSGADVIIGPSRGFGWAEDGTFTLQVDVPSKAGKDVAIVGILWFAPMYPAAFTTYRFGS